MPTLPAVLAEPMTRWMGRPATVTAIDPLSDGLRRVTFTGEALRERRWAAGSEIEFRVTPREFRHYTPAAFDDDAGRIEVVFQLHGSGPGADWARRVTEGDDVLVLGPGHHKWLRPGRRPVFAGEASALGLFEALLAALPAAEPCGVVEVPAVDVAAASALVPALEVVAVDAAPGDAALARLTGRMPADSDVAYLAGHAQSIQRHRAALCAGAGGRAPLRKRDVVTKPFWATGKTGL